MARAIAALCGPKRLSIERRPQPQARAVRQLIAGRFPINAMPSVSLAGRTKVHCDTVPGRGRPVQRVTDRRMRLPPNAPCPRRRKPRGHCRRRAGRSGTKGHAQIPTRAAVRGKNAARKAGVVRLVELGKPATETTIACASLRRLDPKASAPRKREIEPMVRHFLFHGAFRSRRIGHVYEFDGARRDPKPPGVTGAGHGVDIGSAVGVDGGVRHGLRVVSAALKIRASQEHRGGHDHVSGPESQIIPRWFRLHSIKGDTSALDTKPCTQ